MSTAVRTHLPAGGRLTVDLAALADNWRVLARLSAPAETGAAVKADAYGIGLEAAVSALWRAGCRTYFVALPGEGVRLRTLLPQATIYVLNGLFDDAVPAYLTHRLRPVLGSPGDVETWLADGTGRGEPAAIHIDTGLNRLGLTLDETRALAADSGRVAALRPALVMTHPACADTPDHPLNTAQVARFSEARALFPGVPASYANSAAILSGQGAGHDLTRPGIALYGGRALGHGDNPMRPVALLEGRIVQVRDVAAGGTVGYGATFTTTRDSRIAIVSVGYADGYLRQAGNGGDAVAAIGGRRVPLAGRVSMDLIALDVTDHPAELVRRGDWVELFGRTIPLDEAAAKAGTIGYELLTSLGRRHERRTVE